MSNISKSPDRNKFQRDGYVDQCKKEGKAPNQSYLDYFDKIMSDDEVKWENLKAREHNLEYDLVSTDWILAKVRASDAYAQNLYAAMCNNEFTKREMWPILKEQRWGCSWRSAGGIIADMQQKGDYIDWYCSGIRDTDALDENASDWTQDQKDNWTNIYSKYVSESVVTEEIEKDLFELGWIVIKSEDDNI